MSEAGLEGEYNEHLNTNEYKMKLRRKRALWNLAFQLFLILGLGITELIS
jgi:hypothetical protein